MSSCDAEIVRQSIPATVTAQLDELEVFTEIGSTNSYLLEQAAPGPGRFRVAIADYQSAGRGRRDNRWVSPPGSGLCMSMAHTFARKPGRLPALTLAIGTAVVAAVESLRITGLHLKWPNDIIASGRKLGGILVEMQGGNSATIVAGIGLNVDLSGHDEQLAVSLSGEVIDLHSLAGDTPDRSELAATLIYLLYSCMSTYEADGFDAFRSAWQARDWLQGRQVEIEGPDGPMRGTADGIDADGALYLQTRGERRRVISGSVSVLAPAEEPQ